MRGVRQDRAAGFTILELMIAALAFSVVLLVIAVGVISVTDAYYKGVISSQTQAAARVIMNELSQAIEYGQGVNPGLTSSNVQGVCVDNTIYAYYPGIEVTDSNPQTARHQGYHGLIASSGVSCSTSIPNNVVGYLSPPGNFTGSLPVGTRELLSQHMRISVLSVTPVTGAGISNSWQIHVRIIYGDDDLLTKPVTAGNLPTELCRNTKGQQFCAVSDLSTIVQQRLL